MSNSILYENQRIIMGEIEKINASMSNSKIMDEYVYIVLWRPIEWIIDYYALKEELERQPDEPISDFLAKWHTYTSDRKVTFALEDGVFFDKALGEMVDNLRWYRSATIHHREDLNVDLEVFHQFKAICYDFAKREGIELPKLFEQNPDIVLSSSSRTQQMPDIDANLFKETLEYIKSEDAITLVSILKMEYMTQRYAYKLLIDRGCKIKYDGNRGRGIYVDQNKTDSYIDYYVGSRAKTFLSERNTKKKMRMIRDIRNRAIHTTDAGGSIIDEFTNIWLELMQEYYASDENIDQVIAQALENNKSTSSMSMLESFVSTYEVFLPQKLIIDIKDILIPAMAAEKKLEEIQATYQKRIDSASDEEKEQIMEVFHSEINDLHKRIFEKQSKSKIEEYEDHIKECLKEYWPFLSDEPKKSIMTALSVRDSLDEMGLAEADYAGVCIGLTRSLERVLYEMVFNKYRKYFKKHKEDKKRLHKKLQELIDNKKITLGGYEKIWGIEKGYEQEGEIYDNFCREKHMYKNMVGNQLKSVLKVEAQLIDSIKKKYRDKAAHRNAISREKVDECLQAVLEGDNAAIKQILMDMEEIPS